MGTKQEIWKHFNDLFPNRDDFNVCRVLSHDAKEYIWNGFFRDSISCPSVWLKQNTRLGNSEMVKIEALKLLMLIWPNEFGKIKNQKTFNKKAFNGVCVMLLGSSV